MANSTFGRYLYGLRDIKITNAAGSVQEDLDVAIELSFEPEFVTADLEGDDVLKATTTYIKGGTARLSSGALSNAAIAIMFGATVAITSTSPTTVATTQFNASSSMPWFKVYGLAYGDNGDDVHIYLGKCKITGGGGMTLSNGSFYNYGAELRVVDDGSNGVWKVVQHETATTLPAS